MTWFLWGGVLLLWRKWCNVIILYRHPERVLEIHRKDLLLQSQLLVLWDAEMNRHGVPFSIIAFVLPINTAQPSSQPHRSQPGPE